MNNFDKALEIIRERGMCKGAMKDEEDRVCIYGALSLAFYGDELRYAVDVATRHLLDKTATDLFPGRSVHCQSDATAINDHPDTTQEDIELILKHASYEWEQQHHDWM